MTDPDVSTDPLARIGTNNCYKYIIRILVFIIKSSSNYFHFSPKHRVSVQACLCVQISPWQVETFPNKQTLKWSRLFRNLTW